MTKFCSLIHIISPNATKYTTTFEKRFYRAKQKQYSLEIKLDYKRDWSALQFIKFDFMTDGQEIKIAIHVEFWIFFGSYFVFLARAVFNWVSKVIPQLLWFCIATLCDWLKNLAPLPRPIRSKTKTNRDLLARIFPRLARTTCICFELWLVHWIVYDCCDWSE